jgi:hypothetical protein
MNKTFVHEDLNAVIRQHSEWLANQLHSQRESLFPPDAEKTMRKFTSGEAAALLGVNDSYLRKLNLDGKGPRRRTSKRCACFLKKPPANRVITFPGDGRVIIYRSSV